VKCGSEASASNCDYDVVMVDGWSVRNKGNPVMDMEAPHRLDAPRALAKGWMVSGGLVLVILLFATQWYAYDATRRTASPYLYYVGWSCLLWALSPFVLWFARRHPVQIRIWQRSIALHVTVSIALSSMQVLVEAGLGWLRAQHGLSFQAALSHYFVQHVQLYLLTYWSLLAAAQVYRLYDESRSRQLRGARLEMQLSAARLESLRNQLHPHFLFNTLHAAVGLVHQDPDGAEDILLRLSRLLRTSLANFILNEIPLRKELEFIDCYVGIQQRRFGERLRVQHNIDPSVLDFAVPTLILQPLVENAIRHGIGTHKESDLISVNAFQDHGNLRLEVRNRSSTLSGTPEQLLSRGLGLANTNARLRELYGERQTLLLLNLEPRGVCVRLAFPARKCEPKP
jgi:two-component system LytT family sensor kinase